MDDNTAFSGFPLQGVIGVIANGPDEILLASERKLQCVEIRADLLLDNGHTPDDIYTLIKQTKKQGIACLFTLRHPDHGGTFKGSESARVSINRKALESGADLVDAEWNTEAALQLLAEDAPLILSYHDFSAMPDAQSLQALTDSMSAMQPRAIKVVPTAETLADTIRMLMWVENAQDNVSRIGFAMGGAGECSRILTLAFGAPVTYATFGKPVAPGQIDIDLLLTQFRAPQLNADTAVVAVTGSEGFCENKLKTLNEQFEKLSENRVAIAFETEWLESTKALHDELRIVEVVTE
ncbi:MAG: type I 3-dehydroquinate dehydratase [Granulosicoccus sp.]|nr:type I 3-dehydroquinate dehydratase [Granulosicoccus sp.]